MDDVSPDAGPTAIRNKQTESQTGIERIHDIILQAGITSGFGAAPPSPLWRTAGTNLVTWSSAALRVLLSSDLEQALGYVLPDVLA